MQKKGFTLLEVAIVMLIIALVIGGVIAGSEMVRNADIRNSVADAQKYIQATQNFREKYMAMPGDFSVAESLWGTDPNTSATTTATTLTINGNGNGHIGDVASDSATLFEWFRAWQHLANAGLIDGTYTGVTSNAGGAGAAMPGINVPAATISGAGYNMFYYYLPAGSSAWWPAQYNHIIGLGTPKTSVTWTYGWVFTPTEMMSIDQKLDDGLPAFGKVMTMKAQHNPNCTTSDTATAAQYRVSFSGLACNLIIITGIQ